jgi:hypothetical protein
MQSALNQHFNLDRHSKRYPIMTVSIHLDSLLASNISMSIGIQNVIRWWLLRVLSGICSQSTFQSWSLFKMLSNDDCFKFSVQFVLNQHFNLDRHINGYKMITVSSPLCNLFSIDISILIVIQNIIKWWLYQVICAVRSQSTFQSWSSFKHWWQMLVWSLLNSLFAINISILIVISTVIKWCLFQVLSGICSQSTFQSWSSFKTLSNDDCFKSSV